MRWEAAQEILERGGRVRLPDWPPGEYIQGEGVCIVTQSGDLWRPDYLLRALRLDSWQSAGDAYSIIFGAARVSAWASSKHEAVEQALKVAEVGVPTDEARERYAVSFTCMDASGLQVGLVRWDEDFKVRITWCKEVES